jgi:tight adherence protein B
MSDSWIRVLVLVLVFATVLLVTETFVSGFVRSRSQGREVNKRLAMIGRGTARTEVLAQLRRKEFGVSGSLPPLVQSAARKLEYMLMASGTTMPTGQLMLLLVLAPVIVLTLIIIVMFALGSPIGPGRIFLVATFAILAGCGIPLVFLNAKATRRRKKMQEQFPVALDVFVRGLRAGHPVAAALDLLTVEMPDPIGSQFGVVVDEVTYGADLKDALHAMADRWDMDDMRMFVVSLAVQSETGGNLAEILENLSKVIRDRAAMMMKVRALSSEGRMTAIMLTALPILAFTGLFMLNPGFYLDVADDPAFIPGFLGLIILYAVGFITIRRMVDLKV